MTISCILDDAPNDQDCAEYQEANPNVRRWNEATVSTPREQEKDTNQCQDDTKSKVLQPCHIRYSVSIHIFKCTARCSEGRIYCSMLE
jgi:hypothetical protein